MSRWLMIGTSPTVTSTLPAMRRRLEFDSVITTNGGIWLEPSPTVYVLVDMFASIYYEREARHAQVTGTRLVTLNRGEVARVTRRIDHFDEFLDLPGQASPQHGKYGRFRYSGPLCLEYAAMHGATEIRLVGFDGYRHNHDYYHEDMPGRDKPRPRHYGATSTRDVLRPACQDIARAWPSVQFVQHGHPAFNVDAKNWKVEEW